MITDLVALVTGSASGIGLACTRSLRARGITVAGLDRTDEIGHESGRRDEDPGDGPAAAHHTVVADVTDEGAVDTAVAEIVDRYGRLDIVVNCAGVGAVGTALEGDLDLWRRLHEVNVLGIVRTTRAAHAHLLASAHASIVNIGSIAGNAGLPLRAAYSATKGAVHALTLAMAADGIPDGIRVNAVAPGTVDTPWVARLLDAADDPITARARLEARQPLGRLGAAREIAEAVAHLAGPGAGFTTGTILSVDGGMGGLRTPPSSR